ncbi:hypothetical protein J5N97_015558 [Dioscorea zingiberensis]|uniref:Uncharacterized protein n=1 Tax=Dioscorea zingiberensis TaxID=325984 RepID=A0A9D5HEQ2_9LILI|nr:hypothetical protein J5N97_015558 [Dioscorea zingiberensis]
MAIASQTPEILGDCQSGQDWHAKRWRISEPKAAAERLRASGLLKTQALIGGKWIDAYDGKTIQIADCAKNDRNAVLRTRCCICTSDTRILG